MNEAVNHAMMPTAQAEVPHSLPSAPAGGFAARFAPPAANQDNFQAHQHPHFEIPQTKVSSGELSHDVKVNVVTQANGDILVTQEMLLHKANPNVVGQHQAGQHQTPSDYAAHANPAIAGMSFPTGANDINAAKVAAQMHALNGHMSPDLTAASAGVAASAMPTHHEQLSNLANAGAHMGNYAQMAPQMQTQQAYAPSHAQQYLNSAGNGAALNR